jgi:outer membrane protein assembly factor BamC
MKLTSIRIFLPLLAAGLMAGCSSFSFDSVLPDNTVDYRKQGDAGKNLEVPPDLTSRSIKNRLTVPGAGGVSVTYSELASEASLRGNGTGTNVLPKIGGVQVMRDGQERWLVIDGDANTVWNRTVDFWQESGVPLVEQDPVTGVMRTAWIENRASIGRDAVTDTLRSVFDGLYDAGTRDQYRVRIERVGNNRTELYLTHFGVEEQIATDAGGSPEQTVWNHRPRDPNLEAEMLRRLMVHLGLEANRAKSLLAASGEKQPQKRSHLVLNNSSSSLTINEDFAHAWRLSGLALDRSGFSVQDRNRSAGVYYVRYTDPDAAQSEDKGWLSKLAFWSDDETPQDLRKTYQVHVKGAADGATVVTVHDDKGQLLNTKVARRILTLMHDQLR